MLPSQPLLISKVIDDSLPLQEYKFLTSIKSRKTEQRGDIAPSVMVRFKQYSSSPILLKSPLPLGERIQVRGKNYIYPHPCPLPPAVEGDLR
jgi:hypothetical protein